MSAILKVENLNVTLHHRRASKKLVENVSFEVRPGECLGILGESGSGKSMTVKSVLGLLDKNFQVSGSAIFDGQDLLKESKEELRRLRGSRITMVLQNPMTCFDPLYRIGNQMAETFATHTSWNAQEIRTHSLEILEQMRIRNGEEVLEKYPHQLSGGMLQRIMIGIAMALQPELLIADEPTTAIDAITQYEILEEFIRIKKQKNTAMLFITHDLGAISKVADRILVMNSGHVVDSGSFTTSLSMPMTRTPACWWRNDLPSCTATARSYTERRVPMLEVNNVCVSFRSERQEKLFGITRDQVLFDVSLKVPQGTCLGILGESGSGKSTLGRVISGLLKPDSGELKIHDTSVYASRSGRKNLQKRLSVVFQDYTTSANPRFRVKEIIAEGLSARERNQKVRLNRAEETSRLLELVGLNASYADRYPHELSGGQLQRVCIARAVACQPEIILFDEAISSLDAHTQVQIMDLLRELKEKLGLTYIFITHDLTSVTYLCDDVLFLYHGRITEHIPVSRIAKTKDEYAKKLLASMIEFD